MEVEEETTSNHLEDSMAAETTTVINESLLENTTSTDKESEKELTKLISESNTREEEKSSDSVPQSDDSEAFVMAAVGEKEEDAKADEVVVHCRNSESATALSGGIENSVVVDSLNVVEDSKDGDGAVKEIDVPSDDVAAVECGVGELTCPVNVEGGDVEEAVVEPNGDPAVENNGENTRVGEISVIEKDENGFKNEGDTNVQLEDFENVQEMVGSVARNDGGDVQVENIDNIQGDEAITEEQVVTEVVKEEEMVADEEKSVDDSEDFKKETFMANEETIDGVSENDEKDTMVAEEQVVAEAAKEEEMVAEDEKETMAEEDEKSLDTEMETEKSFDTEMETEKSLDTEMETEKSLNTEMEDEEESELPESSTKGSSAKRKRGGKISKSTPKLSATPRKTIEEDVCFICFDGGDLVLCDRRNCPKAYHPSCVNRDEAFFQSKGRWNCGWHLCSICEKKAEYMCYTCTYSLCKGCTKTSVILCVREKEKKGLCEACMKTVMLIEKQENQGNVNFEDKNSWEHLFRDYWTETKAKHNLSLAELEQAKNRCKGSGKQESFISQSGIKDDNGSGSDNPPETLKTRKSKRNTKKQKSAAKEDDSSTVGPGPENTEWVSKDLLEFVTHMRNGDSSVISQFEVQDLLLEYIKRNKLRDPNRKSQIICDARLENLFGKPRVAHIEMLKLLESHFLAKEDSQIDDFQGSVVDTEVSPGDDKDKKRKGRKRSDRRGPQSNREDYAAIDTHNISLIYLRRKLVEDLLDDMEGFHEKIVGTFVRIRISGINQKQDIYRLVQVTGTSEAARYTLSKRTTCTMLEILNLDKTETISIDSISNQDFMEDECKRLRQSIKCGLINRLTVGDVLDKAMELQAVRVNDWLETEIVRLNHLRDRASDLGRKKELRECVEKLNVLKTPEERARRLEEFPLIHDDPTMDPEYGSEDDTDSDDKKQELYKRSDSFRFSKRGRDQFSPRGDYITSKESWSGTPRSSSSKINEFTESWSGTPRSSSGKNLEFTESWSGTPRSSSSKNYEFTKNLSNKSFSNKVEDATYSNFEVHTENSRDQRRDPFVQQPIILEKPSVASPRETTVVVESGPKVNETEKLWHYKDPSEKVQGPFSMIQLRKWSKNGYFPVGLKIWRRNDKEDDGILLTDALEGKFTVVDPRPVSQDGQNLNRDRNHGSQISHINSAPDTRHEFASLPSPTPKKGTTPGWTGEQTGPSSSAPNNVYLIACGNKDGNSAGSVGVSVAVAPQNVDQGVQNPVQSSQFGQPVAPPDGNIPSQMVQSVTGQTPQGWSGAPPQNMQQPNPAMNMAGLQPLMYNQWTGVPNMVQNPVANFMPVAQEPWAQQFPFPVNQTNMQQQQLPQQPQPNVNWGAMVANPNTGWVGPNTGTPMNWGPMVQGPQVTGTVDPTWVMQAGNAQAGWVPQPVQAVVPNQNWVATPIQGPTVAGNGNPSWVGPGPPVNNQVAPSAGWVAPTVNHAPANMNTGGWVGGPLNQAAPVPNQGWVPPTGNQGGPPSQPPPPGNTNQNWSGQNHGGNWGRNENRGNFTGQRRNRGNFRGNRRNFNNRQESFHRDGGSFHRDGGSFHRDGGSTHLDGGSFNRDGGLIHEDGGSIHEDGGSFHGVGSEDTAKSSDQ